MARVGLSNGQSLINIQNRVDSGATLTETKPTRVVSFRQPVKDVASMRTNGVELQGMRRKQLAALAKKAGIQRYRRLSKARLTAALLSLQRLQPEATLSSAELPTGYGRTHLILMEIEPFWAYAYWEVTPQDRLQAAQQAGAIRPAGQWILRFYDITGSERFDPEGRDFFDLPVDLEAGHWYVNFWSGGRSYCAELGMVPASAGFIPVCRSNVITIPPSAPPPGGEPRWLKVQGIFAQVEAVREPEQSTVVAPCHSEVRTDPVPQAPLPTALQVGAAQEIVLNDNRSGAPDPLPVRAQAVFRVPETVSSFGLGKAVESRRDK
jgi:hypothetical protein